MSIQKFTAPEVPPRRWTSHTIEWGLGSILLGLITLGLFLLWGAGGALGMWVSHRIDHSAYNVRATGSVLALCSLPLMGLAGLGLLFGIWGLYQAVSRKLPAGIALTGMVICLLGLALLGIGRVTFADTEQNTLRHLEQWR